MVRQRPVAVLVMAILNMVFGGLGLLGYVCSGIILALSFAMPMPRGMPMDPRAMFQALQTEVPAYWPIEISHMAVNFLLAFVLVVAGIGLLGMRNWGRWISACYAGLMILVQTTHLVFALVYVSPVVQQWQQEQAAKMPPGVPPAFSGNRTLNNLGPIAVAVLFVGYAIALLIVVFLPHVNAAFAGRAPRRTPKPDEYDK